MADILYGEVHEEQHQLTYLVNAAELGIGEDDVSPVTFTFIDGKFTGFELPFKIIAAKWQWRLLNAIKDKYDELKVEYGE